MGVRQSQWVRDREYGLGFLRNGNDDGATAEGGVAPEVDAPDKGRGKSAPARGDSDYAVLRESRAWGVGVGPRVMAGMPSTASFDRHAQWPYRRLLRWAKRTVKFSMARFRPIVARTPADLAGALGLSTAEAKEWQVQHDLLKRLKEIVAKQGFTHAEIARRAGTSRTSVTARLN